LFSKFWQYQPWLENSSIENNDGRYLHDDADTFTTVVNCFRRHIGDRKNSGWLKWENELSEWDRKIMCCKDYYNIVRKSLFSAIRYIFSTWHSSI
jgi:hypothetical protein